MPYELIIFDLDGTLLDSQAHVIECTKIVCNRMGLALPSSEMIRSGTSLAIEQQIARLFPSLDLSHQQQVLALFREYFWGESRAHRLFEGALQTLLALNELGVVCAIATNMSRSGLNEVMVATGLNQTIASSRTVDECAAKPNPQMLIDLMDSFGIVTPKTLFVGDTVIDLQCGQAAGVDVVAIDYTGDRALVLGASNPVMVIRSLVELLDWLVESRR